MHTNQNHKTTYRIITALLLILWVAFIFSNSMDNANASTLKSGTVLALLRRILGSEGAALTEFIVRKTAHFTEFAIEGLYHAAAAVSRVAPAGRFDDSSYR